MGRHYDARQQIIAGCESSGKNMQLKILGNMGGSCLDSLSTAALINDNVLVDCGTGAQNLSIEDIGKIDDVILTHSHLDHTVMLFFLLECKIGKGGVTLHCLQETADAIRRNIFNDDIWPDMEHIKVDGDSLLNIEIIKPYETVTIAGQRITPLPVEHAIPTNAYCLHGDKENFVFIADLIDAEDKFWDYLGRLENFNRMTIELSFPDRMRGIAEESRHLTPSSLAELMKKIPSHVQIYYCHVKPQFQGEIMKEAEKILGDRAQPLQLGQVFDI